MLCNKRLNKISFFSRRVVKEWIDEGEIKLSDSLLSCFRPVLGNVSAFCTLAGKSSVDAGTRVMILDVMNVILALSVVMFCFLPASSPRRKNPDQAATVTDPASEPKPEDCAEALRQAWLVFTDTHMLALMILFVYSGS